jgi:hypothetical protein
MIEVPTRGEVDQIAARADAEGCLHWPPAQLPPPIGYVCSITDPDGNVVEFSFDQGVYAKAPSVLKRPFNTVSASAYPSHSLMAVA